MAETSQSVHCMRCRKVRFTACVGMSWRAEPSDSRMTVSSRRNERLTLKAFAGDTSFMQCTVAPCEDSSQFVVVFKIDFF